MLYMFEKLMQFVDVFNLLFSTIHVDKWIVVLYSGPKMGSVLLKVLYSIHLEWPKFNSLHFIYKTLMKYPMIIIIVKSIIHLSLLYQQDPFYTCQRFKN